MNYSDGQEMRLGDRVEDNGQAGVIVCCVDTDEYSGEFPRTTWDFLEGGVLIQFEGRGLVHYLQPDEDLRLVARAATG